MTSDHDALAASPPSVHVATLTFSDRTKIQLAPNDIVILVGPNNSGKSAALRQIQRSLGNTSKRTVILSSTIATVGTDEGLRSYVRSQSQTANIYGDIKYVGYNYAFRPFELETMTLSRSDRVRDFFSLRCSTDDRLSGSNPVKSIAYRKDQPSHPMHMLIMDRDTEKQISQTFFEAFGEHLYVDRAGGADVSFYVGNIPIEEIPSDAFSKESVEFFSERAIPLRDQGDGMRAFTTVAINVLATAQQSVILIDEPEAFLHPPQARLLGRVISLGAPRDRQIFIATHSADVLKGVVDSATRDIHILRITRNGEVNTINKLDPKLAGSVSADPLIRYSGVFEGIFYKHLMLCEADTDCQFYSAILESLAIPNSVRPDVLFVHGSGKHRLVKLAKISRQLGVPFSTIVDVDVLNERPLFKDLVDVAGLSWAQIEPLWRDVTQAINAQKVRLSASQLVASVEEVLGRLKRKEIGALDFLGEVREVIRSNSPWAAIKRAGRSALPGGEIVAKFDELLRECAKKGLWIVPVGELEGFCRSIGGDKGSAWIARLLESQDLQSSSELTDARAFMTRIWQRAEGA